MTLGAGQVCLTWARIRFARSLRFRAGYLGSLGLGPGVLPEMDRAEAENFSRHQGETLAKASLFGETGSLRRLTIPFA